MSDYAGRGHDRAYDSIDRDVVDGTLLVLSFESSTRPYPVERSVSARYSSRISLTYFNHPFSNTGLIAATPSEVANTTQYNGPPQAPR